jgi:hypothetical protein
MGKLLLGNVQTAAADEQSETQTDYRISDIVITGTTADISLHTVDDCSVVVSIYEETDGTVSGEPYAIGSTKVNARDVSASVTFDQNMPEYYDVKAYLVDTDTLRPLSTEYETDRYTLAMQLFLSLKTTDFQDEYVLNLDDDTDTNFAVVREDTVFIKEEASGDGNNQVNKLSSCGQRGCPHLPDARWRSILYKSGEH